MCLVGLLTLPVTTSAQWGQLPTEANRSRLGQDTATQLRATRNMAGHRIAPSSSPTWGSAASDRLSMQNNFNLLGQSESQSTLTQPIGQFNSSPSSLGTPANIHAATKSAAIVPGVEPIYWGSHGLAIPYRWAGQVGNRGANEVVLYVSKDRGSSWQKVSSAAPQVHSFQYQAPGDGEYFFAIRTYDRFGGHQPAGPLQAEMQVIVDTKSPRNPLVTAEVREGVLVAKIVLHDATEVEPNSLRLYAQSLNQPNWSPVQLEALTDGSTGSTSPQQLAAIGRWRLPIGAREVSIRASVADKAGNRSETNATASSGEMLARASMGTSFTSNPYGLPPSASADSKRSANPVATQDPFAVANQQHGNRSPGVAPISSPWGATSQATNIPPAGPVNPSNTDYGYGQLSNRFASSPSSPSQPWPAETSRTKPLLHQNQMPQTQPSQIQRSLAQQQPLATNQAHTPFRSASFGSSEVRNQFERTTKPNTVQSLTTNGMVTNHLAQSVARIVNSTNFEFDYELDQTGKWGVANVELWGTTDGGNSWRRFAIDSDRLSPIHVTVPGEGDYGFKILVESVGGFEPTPPRPGDTPEVTVRVDQTLPQVMIQRAEQGQGYQADRLDIHWSAMEEFPVERPIDLFYSNRASGPWIPLATSLDNTGRYSWRIQRHLPEQVYLRIEARDEAGNVGSAVTPNAVAISVPQTTGSLRSIRTAPGVGF